MRTSLLNIYDYLLSYFTSPDGERFLLLVKSLSIMVCFLLLVCIGLLLFQSRSNIRNSMELVAKSVGAPSLPKKRMTKKWERIFKRIETGQASDWKLAVIEADKILDDVLKKSGYPGENMGQRLKQITPAQIANIEAIWQVHKLRNSIVHEPDFRLIRSQAAEAVKVYQRALEDFEVL